MNDRGEVILRKRRLVEASLGRDQVLANIGAVVEAVRQDRTISAAGIGTPGTYVQADDSLYGSPHTPIYETPGFVSDIRRVVQVPLMVENDANCLALAEFFASCEGLYRYVMAVIIGTGMGFGLILDNKLYRGARGAAGEIGHTSINFRGRKCECGRVGCAEAYLSGPSLSRRFHEKSGKDMVPPDIYRLYTRGDPEAVELFEETLLIMGEVLANVVNALDLEAIILGGGVSNLPIWRESLSPFIQRSLFGVPRETIPIIPARLGDSAGVIGAAYLALRHLGFMDF